MATSDASLSVSHVALTVRDLDRVGDFYQRVIGLNRISGDAELLTLGQGDRALVQLRRDPQARSHPQEAGLYHTAFLLPARQDLGRWLRHAGGLEQHLDGAADHLVSEAVYLHDPEGNGIEIYVDRPRDSWTFEGTGDAKRVVMANSALDFPGLMQAQGDWTGAPDDTVIGHVHLQVGDIPMAEAFYTGTLGLDLMAARSGASFYAADGYHHHLATNIWNSRGAGPRSADTAGLAELVLSAQPDRATGLGGDGFTDPWGNRITIAPRHGGAQPA
ncbi:VOC family protein [Paracoccus sp. M683]|uniref:VOC family protein n=1 Tax=Paracoccus sp. M683 TaxID=2594268 RepID=UPI001180A172|nr:VOC family protein [Paracoccus sp. M683]TRW99228.1 VOC family protein [Paracoccus sp. M683]